MLAILSLAACGRGDDEPSLSEASTPAPIVATLAPEPTATPVQVSQAASQAQDVGKVPPPESINSGPASALALDARNGMYDAPPAMEIDANQYYYATLKTDRGNIKVQLFADRAPITVNNFVFLARQGYYDNTMFHRVLDGFMAQAGDPTGTGSGGPGYEFEDEIYPGLVFDRSGLLAMANRGPATNGSQFFITFAPTEWLNGGHTIFGEVIEGADVLNKITRRDPVQTPNFPGDTIYTIVIEEANTSVLPTPSPSPPTPTPTPTPTPFAPSSLDSSDRPLAKIPAAERANYFNVPPEMALDAGKRYVATITTSRGELVVNLHDDQAPLAVNNFVLLANLGFYDDTPVALVRPDDSIIIGAPDNNPLNDAGYKFAAEVGADIEMEIGAIAYIPFDRLPDGAILSSSSQLLIALIKPPPAFNANFSFFGQIVEGLEVLKQLTTEDGIKTIAIEVAEE